MSDLLQEGLGEGVFMCPGRNGPSLAFVPQKQGQRGCGWRTVSRISSLENTHKQPPVKNSTFVQEADKSLTLGMSTKIKMHNLRAVKFYWGQNEDCSQRGSNSDNSGILLQRSSRRRSIYKVLVKAEFSTIKHSFYKRLFASHEDLMSP